MTPKRSTMDTTIKIASVPRFCYYYMDEKFSFCKDKRGVDIGAADLFAVHSSRAYGTCIC